MSNLSKPVIAVFGSALHSEKEFRFISTLERACEERDFFVLAFSFSGESMMTGQGLEAEFTLINLIRDIPLDGIVIMRESLTSLMLVDEILKLAKKRDIPVFSVEKPTAGCINITFDYKESFKMMIRHVVEEHKCTDIAMIAGMRNNEFSDERIEACREALAEYGLELKENRLFYGDFWERPTYDVTRQIIESGDIPQAICCANDAMAVTVTQALKEAGINVPEDVLVTGFDGIMSGQLNVPPISTMTPDYQKEVDIILDHICNADPETGQSGSEGLCYVLNPNRSCGCTGPLDLNIEAIVSELSAGFSDVYWVMEGMNRVVSDASGVDSIDDLSYSIDKQIGMWIHNFYHVAVFAELMGKSPSETSGQTYRILYRNDNGSYGKTGDEYSEQVFLPGLDSIISDRNLRRMLIIRMLHTGNIPYGYYVEGFKEITNRDIHRGEEFATFISTAITVALANIRLRHLNHRLQEANNEIENISVTDYLTGILNRRGFFSKVREAVTDPANFGRYLSLFSIDMDGLKSINDKYGHDEGDYAISIVADAIRSFSARNGFCSRYGGDEFSCVIITDAPLELSADEVRDRLCSVIRRVPEAAKKPYPITASIGSGCHIIESDPIVMNRCIEEMVHTADEAMYRDKKNKQQHFEDLLKDQ
ncbi:diguanylate cyclase (GGDEF) domain-containing protein [Lachnospiraceae bacterium XBB2008]|nr:diguanylate cyclase (GGDEF) domain-containing protein [Lachnospiraceae bacterium XBB2008]